MNCQERQEQIMLYAADALDDVERADLLAHLAGGCGTCHAALAEARETLGALAGSLPAVAPPPQVKERLMARIAAERDDAGSTATAVAGVAPAPRPPAASAPTDGDARGPAGSIGIGRVLLAAAAAAVITAAGVYLALVEPTRQDRQAVVTELQDREQEVGRLRSLLASRQLALVSLASTADQQSSRGRLLLDQTSGNWELLVFDLAPLEGGRVYELWLLDDEQKPYSAGTFQVSDAGVGRLIGDAVPEGMASIALAAVTDEPAGGSPTGGPTGTIRIAGKPEVVGGG